MAISENLRGAGEFVFGRTTRGALFREGLSGSVGVLGVLIENPTVIIAAFVALAISVGAGGIANARESRIENEHFNQKMAA